MKVLSLFSGIGAFEKAFDNLGIPYELVAFCEIDKHASKSYAAIHNVPESMNLGDITKVDEKALPKDIDLITYGFPCQDISLAGKQKGLFNEDGSQTRSGLFFEALRIIEETKPRVAIAENVKNLTSKKFKEQFKIVLDSLDEAGYNNYWKVLNAKYFGVPQNRERVFIVSIRKDVDKPFFHFPNGFPLEIRLKDILEEVVDEKYYLNETQAYFIKHSFDMEARGNGFRFEPHVHKNASVAKTITTRAGARMDDNFILDGEFETNTFKFDSNNPFIVIDDDSVKVREATKKGYAEAFKGDSINLEQPNSQTRRGRVGKQVAQTLTTTPQQAVVEPMAYDEQNGYIRKDGCVGTITTDGSSPKHNNRVIVWDGFNQRVRADQSCVGTLTQNCGADLKRNGQGIIEIGTRKDIKQAERYCEYCGTELVRKRFNGRLEDFSVFNKRKYCNRECMKRGFLKIGKGDQTWTSAHHTARKINELILQKDSCELCGSTQNLDIHHIDGNWQNNNLDNLMCLCRSCHTKHERNKDYSDLRIRKLTPRETWRLMGFADADFEKAEAVNSNTQLYKQAGNSIVVPVLEYIFEALIECGALLTSSQN